MYKNVSSLLFWIFGAGNVSLNILFTQYSNTRTEGFILAIDMRFSP